ncbi:hypothetical protein ACFQJD_14820 [Haloplanus sp. GCM10025708]|uniref:hypothetical protein n=1 Tax=Haloferacaceae TaxID=1644056 RepID=UPI00360E0C3C
MSSRTYRLHALGRGVTAAVRAVAFWSAVALPFSVAVLLVADAPLDVVGALLACNAVALVLGHRHHQSAGSRTSRA